MNDNFKDKYKVKKNPIEMSYEYQMGLKNNEEYEDLTNRACEKILNYFSELYKEIAIEIPKEREKSPKSLLGKIKNLQIERLSKLYAIEGINEEEKEQLNKLMQERIYESVEENTNQILSDIKLILYSNVEDINVQKIIQNIMIDEISNSTKTALLRILVSKLEKSNLTNKKDIIGNLDKKYGEQAAIDSGIPEDDIIRYSSIKNIREDKGRIEQLHNELRYLKAKDLRGMKIVITNVPDNFETKNQNIKKILKDRKDINENSEKIKNNHMCSMEIGKEFLVKLINNKSLLEDVGIEIMPYSLKYKKKTNGYEAEHIKFQFINNPEYTFELQIKSLYIEELSKGKGTAAHESRPGKARIFPTIDNERKFIKDLQFTLPKYTVFKKEGNSFEAKKCNIMQNTMAYFQNQLDPQSEEYEKAINLLRNENFRGF